MIMQNKYEFQMNQMQMGEFSMSRDREFNMKLKIK